MKDKTLRFPQLGILPLTGERLIRTSATVKASDGLVGVSVGDDFLKGDGIERGDVVVYRTRFDASELTPGKLVAVSTPTGTHAGHYYKSPSGQIRIVGSNASYEDMEFAGPVSVHGIVVRRERDYGGEP
jgi:SOS-response transcriptional repressor LexA